MDPPGLVCPAGFARRSRRGCGLCIAAHGCVLWKVNTTSSFYVESRPCCIARTARSPISVCWSKWDNLCSFRVAAGMCSRGLIGSRRWVVPSFISLTARSLRKRTPVVPLSRGSICDLAAGRFSPLSGLLRTISTRWPFNGPVVVWSSSLKISWWPVVWHDNGSRGQHRTTRGLSSLVARSCDSRIAPIRHQRRRRFPG